MVFFFSDGRLGNQIFQLAFLMEIASPKNGIFTINLGQALSILDVDLKILNLEINNRFFRLFCRRFFRMVFEFLSLLKIISIIYEDLDLVTYKKRDGLIRSVTYVRTGFFQSERFFNREDFLKKVKIKGCYLDAANDCLKGVSGFKNKIFIHVRRGDYLEEVYNQKRGINLPMSYYRKGMGIVNNELSNVCYVIISDDIEFINNHFMDISNKIIVHSSFAVDFAVMTLCDGGIMSNSSYSWWGGFFINNSKLVIMPKYWYGWKDRIQSHKGINLSFSRVIDF